MSDTENHEDGVLRRMLRTPPKPHGKPGESNRRPKHDGDGVSYPKADA